MSDLRAAVEALPRMPMRLGPWEGAGQADAVLVPAVLALIPEGAVLVTEESLAEALSVEMAKGLTWFYMGYVAGDLILDDWRACAAAILAALNRGGLPGGSPTDD